MERDDSVRRDWTLRPLVRWSFLLLVAAVIPLSFLFKLWRLPTNVSGYQKRAVVDIESGNYEAAIANLTRAIELEPGDPDLYVARGDARSKAGSYDEALSDYGQALKLDRYHVGAYTSRALAKEAHGDYAGAISDLTKAISSGPDDAETFGARARVREKAGDEELALADYTRAIRLDPDRGESYLGRATLRYEQRRWQAALEDVSKARELLEPGPALDEAWLLLWSARARLGDVGGASAELRDYLARRKPRGHDDWFIQVARFLAGELTAGKLIAAAESGNAHDIDARRCESYFFAATERLAAGDRREALGFLRKCLSIGDCHLAGRAGAEARGLLFGFQAKDLDEKLRDSISLGPGIGLLVTDVSLGGPAARAGLTRGDIVVALDGAPASADELKRLEREAELGRQLTAEVIRDGQRQRIALTLAGEG
jgi:tetratricopeptide (TPR) repeat protein